MYFYFVSSQGGKTHEVVKINTVFGVYKEQYVNLRHVLACGIKNLEDTLSRSRQHFFESLRQIDGEDVLREQLTAAFKAEGERGKPTAERFFKFDASADFKSAGVLLLKAVVPDGIRPVMRELPPLGENGLISSLLTAMRREYMIFMT